MPDLRKRFRGRKRFEAKRRILDRDGYRCQICGRIVEAHDSELDHITPIEQGGTHDDSNLRTCCIACHAQRHGGKPKRSYDAKGNPVGDDAWGAGGKS